MISILVVEDDMKLNKIVIGIDDYIVKPFDMEKLILRIGALLCRANIQNEKN